MISPRWLNGILLPLISGVLFACAFPPVGYAPLALAGVTLFLLSLRGLPPKAARVAGFLFGMAAYGIGLSWFWNLFSAFSLALYGLLSLYVALFAWGCACFDQTRWHPALKVLATATLWTGIELVRAEIMWLKFTWLTPGHAMGTLNSSDLLALIGVHGVSFVVVLLAAMFREGWQAWQIIILMLMLAMIPSNSSVPSKPDLPVAALQSESGGLGWFDATTRTLKNQPALILWPEEALPYDLGKAPNDREKLAALAKEMKAVIVLGTQERIDAQAWHNTALTVGPEGKLGTHFKVHPVHFFNDGTPGTTALPVTTPLGKIGTPICFDCDFQPVTRKMTQAGAEFFAVPSMDEESWGLKQHLQHAQMLRIRAAENGRWMLIAASSGVTQLINPLGQQVAMIEPMQQGVLTGMIGKDTQLTFYTRFGWLFPWVCLVLGIGLILAAWRASRLPARQSPPHSPHTEL